MKSRKISSSTYRHYVETISGGPGFRIVEHAPSPDASGVRFAPGDIAADLDGSVRIVLAYDQAGDMYACVSPAHFAADLDRAFDLSIYGRFLKWIDGVSARMYFRKFGSVDQELVSAWRKPADYERYHSGMNGINIKVRFTDSKVTPVEVEYAGCRNHYTSVENALTDIKLAVRKASKGEYPFGKEKAQ